MLFWFEYFEKNEMFGMWTGLAVYKLHNHLNTRERMHENGESACEWLSSQTKMGPTHKNGRDAKRTQQPTKWATTLFSVMVEVELHRHQARRQKKAKATIVLSSSGRNDERRRPPANRRRFPLSLFPLSLRIHHSCTFPKRFVLYILERNERSLV